MTVHSIDKIALAFAHLAVIRQATKDTEIQNLCKQAADKICNDGIVINDGVDPESNIQNLSFRPFYNAIDECNRIADSSSSAPIKESCLAIAQSLTNIIHKLI